MKGLSIVVMAAWMVALVGCNSPGKKEQAACENVVKLLFKEKKEVAKKAFGSEEKGKKLCEAAGETMGKLVKCAVDSGDEKELEKCGKEEVKSFAKAQGKDLMNLMALGEDKDLLALLGPAAMLMGGRKEKRVPEKIDKPAPAPKPAPVGVVKKPAPTPTPAPVVKVPAGKIPVTYKGRTVIVDKALAFWTNDWTLRVYAVTRCPQFQCNHVSSYGWVKKKELKALCPDYAFYGVEFKSHWGVRMRPGVWSYKKTDNEPIDASPYVRDSKVKGGWWFSKGAGTIQIVSLTDTSVSVNANFKDSRGSYTGVYTATICPPSKKPQALIVTALMPPPHKPLLAKARLLQLKPTVPADLAGQYHWVAWFPRDGRISWNLNDKTTKKTAITIRIADKRNELYTRVDRRKKLFGKYPMTRFTNSWMWTYVGNFNIDVSTTGGNDPRFKNNAMIEKIFNTLQIKQFESL